MRMLAEFAESASPATWAVQKKTLYGSSAHGTETSPLVVTLARHLDQKAPGNLTHNAW